MKTKYYLLFSLTIATILFCSSCGSKISVKGKDGKKYHSYQEACTANDFTAAYQFRDEMENGLWYESSDIQEATKYIVEKESLYLLSIMDESADRRVVVLWHENSDKVSDKRGTLKKIIDIAIELDRGYAVERLASEYLDSLSDDEFMNEVNLFNDYCTKKGLDEFVQKTKKRLEDIERLNQPIPITLASTSIQGNCGNHFQIVKNAKGYALVKDGDKYKLSVTIKRVMNSSNDDEYGLVYAVFHLMDENGNILKSMASENCDFYNIKKGSPQVITAKYVISHDGWRVDPILDKQTLLAVKSFMVEFH